VKSQTASFEKSAKDKLALEFLKETTDLVQTRMTELLEATLPAFPKYTKQSSQLVCDKGQRLLSAFLRSIYEDETHSFSEVVSVCAAMELLQVAALLVDDVLDESLMRNGQRTIVAENGFKNAVALGFLLSASAKRIMRQSLTQRWNLTVSQKVMDVFDEVQQRVYEGQILDLQSIRKIDFSEHDYFTTITNTTAYFIRAPLVSGAILKGASNGFVEQLGEIGLNLGLAYQLRDDVIDWLGDSSETGKTSFADLEQRRMRLPLIHALRTLAPLDKAWLEGLVTGEMPISDSEKQKALQFLTKAGSIDYVIDKTAAHVRTAIGLLDELQDAGNNLRQRLSDIAGLIAIFG
jgi:geranylgeranyl pyrophosphate synthase